jgi:hypothetical protein
VTIRTLGVLVLSVALASQASALAFEEPLTDDIAPFKAMLLRKFDNKQFTELESLERELRSSKARFAGGDWKLFHFYEVLSAGHVIENAPIESDWLDVLARLKEWQRHSPSAVTPTLLLADAYTSYAWQARGSGKSDTVKPEMWAMFKDRLNQAAFYLNASRRLASDHPQWYVAALVIARGLEWPRDRAESVVKEAAAVEPHYQHVYSAMAQYLLPRWYGEPGDWERFAQETADRIDGIEGSAVYNHIALQISNRSLHGNTQFFEQNDVNWRKLQWSFADREKLYGVGIRPLNAMLRLAGGVKDKPAARAFLKRIGESWDQSTWGTRQNFDRFKQWVDADE